MAIAISFLIFSKPVDSPILHGNRDVLEKEQILKSYADRRLARQMWFLGTLFLLVIGGNSLVYYVNATLDTKWSNVKPSALRDLNKNSFINYVKENKSIVNAAVTPQGILAIAVINDGRDKNLMAIYYCRLAKSKNIGVSGVKIVDASDANFTEEYASGTVLAKSFCN
ncbi:hypothetical protein [Adhaeribacter arboris]|nr:hypothetical protein [Adhaeribacter arboris]